MDVAFMGEDLYLLLSGAGPSFLSPSSFSGVYKVNEDASLTLVGDITTWLPQHPPRFVPQDYNQDGSLFDLEATGDSLLLTDAVGGQLLRVTAEGEIGTVLDLSDGHPVPTGIAVDGGGNAYVGFETHGPFGDGQSRIIQVTPDGTVSDVATGLTQVADVTFGPDGLLYAAEMATGFKEGDPTMPPDSGRVVRIERDGSLTPVVTELAYPVQLGFDPDGRLVIATPALGPDRGARDGSLLSVDISTTPVSVAAVTPAPPPDCA
jgi:glucose/arabinose dehydrogenase